jgi:amidophosphoribosyltransferase
MDVIVPVPDSSIAAAEALSAKTGIPVVSAIVRNRYSDRTFIAECGFNAKYTLIPDAIRGKKIILVDDSIVRGHTMRVLVPKLKKLAKAVHVRVTFPPIRHACRYGIRIDGPGCWDVPEADSLEFLDEKHFSGCLACVNGVYCSIETKLESLLEFSV